MHVYRQELERQAAAARKHGPGTGDAMHSSKGGRGGADAVDGAGGGVRAEGKGNRGGAPVSSKGGGRGRGGAKFSYPVGQRVRVLYDDGVWYPGKIQAQRLVAAAGGRAQAQEEYDIVLDDQVTQLTTQLPDADVEIVTDAGGDARMEGAEADDKISYIGVRQRDGYWVAELKRAGQTLKLGHFDNGLDAARAYDAAALKYQGDKARLNCDSHAENLLAAQVAEVLHARVRVLYDDGIWYQGFVSGYDYKSSEYVIRLDDDTTFNTSLPDPDIQILSTSAPPPKGVVAGAAGGGGGVAARRGASQELMTGVRLRVLYDDGVYYPGSMRDAL